MPLGLLLSSNFSCELCIKPKKNRSSQGETSVQTAGVTRGEYWCQGFTELRSRIAAWDISYKWR